MPRTISSTLATILALPSPEVHSTVLIVAASGEEKRFATRELDIAGESFSGGLKSIGEIKQSLTGSTDRVSVIIQNVNRLLGRDLASGWLNFAEIIVGRYFAGNGQTAHVEMFRGKAANIEAGDETVQINVISEIAAIGFVAAIRTLSEKCAFRYKDSFCGAPSSETACNKVWKSKQGCLGRANIHRFGGWTFPNPPQPSVPGSGVNNWTGVGNGGWGIGRNPDFILE
jgi:hypothetical protein